MTDVVQDMDTSEKSEVAETEMAAPEQTNGTINGKVCHSIMRALLFKCSCIIVVSHY